MRCKGRSLRRTDLIFFNFILHTGNRTLKKMDAWNGKNRDVGKDLLKGTAIAGKHPRHTDIILKPTN